MYKVDNEDKSYTLTAETGKDLALKDTKGNITIRAKEVYVSALGTLNVWEEVDELPPEPELPVITDPKKQEIESLEARLSQLKAEVQT